jgi:hypothetical protein
VLTEAPTIKISLLFGLSLLWEYVTIFANNSHFNFEIQFNNNLIKELRNEYGEEYFLLLQDYLLSAISTMNNVKIVPGDDYPKILPHNLAVTLNVQSHSMLIYNSVTSDASLYSNYIVLNTKVISGNDGNIRTLWNEHIKDRFFQILKESNIKIILIGEREYSDCYEYRIHNTFSIYSDIIKSGITNLIDLTVDDTIKLYSKEIISRNLNILRNANFNIHIGEGGGLKIFALCNNLLAFTSVDIQLFHYIKQVNFIKKSYDPNVFLELVTDQLNIK